MVSTRNNDNGLAVWVMGVAGLALGFLLGLGTVMLLDDPVEVMSDLEAQLANAQSEVSDLTAANKRAFEKLKKTETTENKLRESLKELKQKKLGRPSVAISNNNKYQQTDSLKYADKKRGLDWSLSDIVDLWGEEDWKPERIAIHTPTPDGITYMARYTGGGWLRYMASGSPMNLSSFTVMIGLTDNDTDLIPVVVGLELLNEIGPWDFEVLSDWLTENKMKILTNENAPELKSEGFTLDSFCSPIKDGSVMLEISITRN